MPEVVDRRLKGLNDIALHPRFAENKLVYFTYYKPKPGSMTLATAALARGRFDGGTASPTSVTSSSPDALDKAAVRVAHRVRPRRQDLHGHRGSVSRASCWGSERGGCAEPGQPCRKGLAAQRRRHVPSDNPFVGPRRATSRRSTRSGFATLSDSSSIQKPASSGKTRTVLRAATRSTSSAGTKLRLASHLLRPRLYG